MRIILSESQYMYLFEAASLGDIYTKYYSDIPEEVFNQIVSSDPTYRDGKMGKYGKWLLSLYKSNNLKLEDLYKATNYLRCFVDYYSVIQNKDINKIKSLQELYDTVRPYLDGNLATSKSDYARRIKGGAEKVYEDDGWLIVVPHTKEASCYYGKGTQWCTAADKGNNMFDRYNDEGLLYINIDKSSGDKYQFHFESDSFMDATDTPIESPIVENIPITSGAINWYKGNVENWKKLFETKVEFIGSYYLIQPTINDNWYLYEDDYGTVVVKDLVIDSDEIYTYRRELLDNSFTKIKNVYGKYTMLSYDKSSESIQFVASNYTYASVLDNPYSDGYNTFVETVDDNGKYSIIMFPSGYNLYYKNDASKVKRTECISYDVCAIYRTDGYVDLVNSSGEKVYGILPLNGKLELDDSYQYIIASDEDGNEVWIDSETLEFKDDIDNAFN